MLRIAIVEDDPTTASLLAECLAGGDHHVAAVYASGEEALEALRRGGRFPTGP